jgi:general stress protein YciG
MSKKPPPSLRKYLSELAKRGGKARAKKYDKKTLSKWGKRGGRPRKKKPAGKRS